MALVGSRRTCLRDPASVTCGELHHQQRQLQNAWARLFSVALVFKLRGACSLPRSWKTSRCTTKMLCCCTHLPSVEVTSCLRQSGRIRFFLRPLQGTYICICVCIYMHIFVCIVGVCVYKYFAQKHKACVLEGDLPPKNDHFCVCVFGVCFTSKILPLSAQRARKPEGKKEKRQCHKRNVFLPEVCESCA